MFASDVMAIIDHGRGIHISLRSNGQATPAGGSFLGGFRQASFVRPRTYLPKIVEVHGNLALDGRDKHTIPTRTSLSQNIMVAQSPNMCPEFSLCFTADSCNYPEGRVCPRGCVA